MTNSSNNVLYTGVTNDLVRRVYEHKNHLIKGFTQKYKITKLIYFETHSDATVAILREKQIKGGSRDKKLKLVKSLNPNFKDLYSEVC